MSKIILKKSAVAGKQPVVADLEYGELALNYADSKLFFKTADNTIAQIGGTNLSTALQNRYSYVASEGQSNFSAIYIPPYVDVFLNGLRLSPGEDYIATTGTNIVLTPGATISDLVEIVSTTSYTVGLDTALQNRYNYIATALQTSFVANYIPGYVDVYKNGVKLNFLEDFTATNGSQVVLSTGCAVGDLIEIIATTSVAAGNAATATTATNVLGGTANVTALTTSGNLTFSGANNRITGDFSNATLANRVMFQTSTVNGSTSIYAIPNGTATVSGYAAFNSQDVNNASYLNVTANAATTSLDAGKFGTGTYLPMTFLTGGSERVRIDTSGNVGIGKSNPVSKLDIVGDVTATAQFIQTSAGTSTISYTFGGQTTKTGMGCPADGTLAFYAGTTTERVRIDSSGNVGIGTSSPAQRLHVTSAGTSDGVIQLGGTASNGYFSQINQNANNLQLIANGDQAFRASLGTNNGTGNITFLTAGLTTGNTERMRIDSSGNVGIGTSSPSVRFDVVGGRASFTPNSEQYAIQLRYNTSTAGCWIGSPGTDMFAVTTAGGGERMRIDSSGNLLVGKTVTTETVRGVSITTIGQIVCSSDAGADAGVFYRPTTSAGNGVILTKSDIGGVSSLVGAGFANGTFGTVSDINKKKNVEDARGYLSDLMRIRVVKYNWKTDEDSTPKELGWIAQEVAEIFPGMVLEMEGSKLLKKEIFLPMLVKAIQEQQAIITALAARVAALESN